MHMIPIEVWCLILSFLDDVRVIKCTEISKSFNEMIKLDFNFKMIRKCDDFIKNYNDFFNRTKAVFGVKYFITKMINSIGKCKVRELEPQYVFPNKISFDNDLIYEKINDFLCDVKNLSYRDFASSMDSGSFNDEYSSCQEIINKFTEKDLIKKIFNDPSLMYLFSCNYSFYIRTDLNYKLLILKNDCQITIYQQGDKIKDTLTVDFVDNFYDIIIYNDYYLIHYHSNFYLYQSSKCLFQIKTPEIKSSIKNIYFNFPFIIVFHRQKGSRGSPVGPQNCYVMDLRKSKYQFTKLNIKIEPHPKVLSTFPLVIQSLETNKNYITVIDLFNNTNYQFTTNKNIINYFNYEKNLLVYEIDGLLYKKFIINQNDKD